MFCENCGNKIPDGSRFCDKCGAPATPAAHEAPAAPAAPVAPATPAAPEQAPVNYGYTQAPYPTPAPAAPKKPMSPKMKKIIIFGSIGVAVLAAFLIVLFTVIIPAIQKAEDEKNRVDITKYVTLKVDGVDEDDENPSVFDGKISGYFDWDYTKLAKDKNITEESAKTLLKGVQSYLSVSATKDGEEHSSFSFEDAGKDTVYEITIDWPNGNSDSDNSAAKELREYLGEYADSLDPMKTIEKYEEKAGVKFKHKKLSREIKVGDVLEDQGITIKDPVKLDVLSYVKENDLIIQDGRKSGSLSVSVKSFETTIEGYKLSKSDDDYYTSVYLTDKNGKEIGSFELEFDDHSYLDDQATVKLDYDTYDKESLEKKGFILTGDPVEYTVTAPEGITGENVKTYVQPLTDYFNEVAHKEDWLAKDGDVIQLNQMYYSKGTSYEYIVFVYNNKTQKYYKTMYVYLDDIYPEEGKIKNDGGVYTDASGKTVDEAIKNNSYLGSSYNPVKIAG